MTGADGKADAISGFETVLGGEANDTIQGSAVNDGLWGGNGDDTIFGDAGNDSITGDAGNDTIDAGLGQDTVTAGAGNDLILALADSFADTYAGDAGTDILSFQNVTSDLNISGFYVNTSTNFSLNGFTDSYSGLEGLIGGSGNDVLSIHGSSAAAYLEGGAGNDSLTGASGADTLVGGVGDDTISGGAGIDSIDGGEGNDRISFQTTATINGGAGIDTLWFASTATVNLNTLSTFAGSNIEALDLLASGVNVNLTLSDATVIALASANNAGIDDATYANKKLLVINGNAGDALNLTGGQWVDTGVDVTFNSTGSFSVYRLGTSDVYVATNLEPVPPPP